MILLPFCYFVNCSENPAQLVLMYWPHVSVPMIESAIKHVWSCNINNKCTFCNKKLKKWKSWTLFWTCSATSIPTILWPLSSKQPSNYPHTHFIPHFTPHINLQNTSPFSIHSLTIMLLWPTKMIPSSWV